MKWKESSKVKKNIKKIEKKRQMHFFFVHKTKRKLKTNDDIDMKFDTDVTSSATNLVKKFEDSIKAGDLTIKFTLLFEHGSM